MKQEKTREIRHDPVYQNTDRSANISVGEDSRDMGEQRWSTVLCVCINQSSPSEFSGHHSRKIRMWEANNS